MPFEESIANYVRMKLAAVGDVEEKEMFRSLCFMLKGKMCICVGEEGILCRIGAKACEQAVELPGCRQMTNGARTMKNFVLVSEDVLRTIPQMNYWIELALAFNEEAKASKKKAKPS